MLKGKQRLLLLKHSLLPRKKFSIRNNATISHAASPTAVSLNSLNINEEAKNEGTPIVVMHGVLGSCFNFSTMMKSELEKMGSNGFLHKRAAYLLDLRNHGKSPHHPNMTNGTNCSNSSFMDEEMLDKCILVGHSMGGKVAMNLCLKYPERFEKAVIVDVAPASYVDDPRWNPPKTIEAMQKLDLKQVVKRNDANVLLKESIPEQQMRLFILTNLVHKTERHHHHTHQQHPTTSSSSSHPSTTTSSSSSIPSGTNSATSEWGWRVNLDSIAANIYNMGSFPYDAHAITPTWKKYSKPVLFVSGKQSYYLQDLKYSNTIHYFFDNYKIQTIDNATHWVHAEQTVTFMNHVRNFVLDHH